MWGNVAQIFLLRKAILKILDTYSLGRVMTQCNKMQDTSKKVPALRSGKIFWSTMIEILLVHRINPKHLERKFFRIKTSSLMSSTSFPAARVAELFPTKGSSASCQTPKKTQQISKAQTAPTFLQTTSATTQRSLLLWGADVWIEMLHTLLGFVTSVSAHCLHQHHGKEGADELHFTCPLSLHRTVLLSEICFYGLLGSAPAVWVSLLEGWQSRLSAPLNTFPSLQLCPCSESPASGNWIAPVTQFFAPLCSHSQQGHTAPGMVPEYLGRGEDLG